MVNPEAKVESVSPKTATNWLGGKKHNRTVKDPKVLEYALDMEEGRWHIAQPIIFNEDGRLMDGQHRLLAVQLWNKSVKFLVVRGVSDEASTSIDTGIKRSLGDFLIMRGEHYGGGLAAVIRYMWRWDHYKTLRRSAVAQRDPTNQQALDYFDKYADGLRGAIAFGERNRKYTFMSAPTAGTLYIILAGVGDEPDVQEFFRLISEGGDNNKVITALRKRLIDNKVAHSKLPMFHIAALVIKAWNLWVVGEEKSVLVWRAGGATPEPFPEPIAGH